MLAAHNPTGCPATLTTANATHWAQYNTANEVSRSDTMPGGLVYDGAGNVTYDGTNHYVYDLEGRICAVWTPGPVYTQYIYDAEGTRVAKGAISGAALAAAFPPPPQPGAAMPTPYCAAPTAANGFTLTASYLRGAAGQQDVELWAASGAWRQNVRGPDGLFASYNFVNSGATPLSLSFVFNDWLGTKRLEVNASGQLVNWWSSDPFGNYQTPHNSTADPSDQHFTGKERDAESGNDYFGARYYASSMGRFMSPDPSQLFFADQTNPQSLNLYTYVLNNPLSNTDPTGLYCYYGDTDYTSAQGQADQADSSQWDYHSNSSECGGNGGQWFNDAETHTDWYGISWDNGGRDEFAVSAISDASPQQQVQYTSMGPVPCSLCLDPNYNYSSAPKFSIGPRRIPPPPPTPGGFLCAVTPTEAMEYHKVAMQIWSRENLIPFSGSGASDDDTGGEGIGANKTVTDSGQGAKFYVGNEGVDMKPFASQLVPNANLQGAAGSNAAAMGADYAVAAVGCALSK